MRQVVTTITSLRNVCERRLVALMIRLSIWFAWALSLGYRKEHLDETYIRNRVSR